MFLFVSVFFFLLLLSFFFFFLANISNSKSRSMFENLRKRVEDMIELNKYLKPLVVLRAALLSTAVVERVSCARANDSLWKLVLSADTGANALYDVFLVVFFLFSFNFFNFLNTKKNTHTHTQIVLLQQILRR